MILENADQIVRLALVDDIAHLARRRRAVTASGEHHAHGVRTGVRDIPDRAGVLRVPLVCVVDALRNELLARRVDLAARDVERIVRRLRCRCRKHRRQRHCADHAASVFFMLVCMSLLSSSTASSQMFASLHAIGTHLLSH